MMKIKNNKMFLLPILALLVLYIAGGAYAQVSQTVNFNNTNPNSISSSTFTGSNLVVQVLNYEPYPVQAGTWFDVWVKVQNLGQSDASNVEFTLAPAYPFESSDNLVRNYDTIPGTITSYKYSQTSDPTVVILKYRVKAVDNAPEGSSDLKFQITTGLGTANEQTSVTNLPVEIGKTRTDFDVVMQDSTGTGTSFAIANTGSKDATAVTVSVENVTTTGAKSSILGNLASGDFTTVTFQVVGNKNIHEIPIKIDYTDVAGVRDSVIKNVPVNFGSLNATAYGAAKKTTTSNTSNYLYLLAGIIVGAIALQLYKKFMRKK